MRVRSCIEHQGIKNYAKKEICILQLLIPTSKHYLRFTKVQWKKFNYQFTLSQTKAQFQLKKLSEVYGRGLMKTGVKLNVTPRKVVRFDATYRLVWDFQRMPSRLLSL